MYDKLLNNLLTAIRLTFPNGTKDSPAAVAYVRRKMDAMPFDVSAPKVGGNQRTKARTAGALVRIWDRQFPAPSPAYYARDTSDWAGR